MARDEPTELNDIQLDYIVVGGDYYNKEWINKPTKKYDINSLGNVNKEMIDEKKEVNNHG